MGRPGKFTGVFHEKYTLLPHAMGTKFCPKFLVRWGPSPAEMGTRKVYFWKLIKISQYVYQHVQVFEYSSKKFNFTDKLAWYSFKLVLSSEVFKWSTFNRQWLLWLLARSSAWNRENGDPGKKMGTFWGPKNWKRSPWGPRSPNEDPRGSSGLRLLRTSNCSLCLCKKWFSLWQT